MKVLEMPILKVPELYWYLNFFNKYFNLEQDSSAWPTDSG